MSEKTTRIIADIWQLFVGVENKITMQIWGYFDASSLIN